MSAPNFGSGVTYFCGFPGRINHCLLCAPHLFFTTSIITSVVLCCLCLLWMEQKWIIPTKPCTNCRSLSKYCCSFKPLNLGVICFAVIETELDFGIWRWGAMWQKPQNVVVTEAKLDRTRQWAEGGRTLKRLFSSVQSLSHVWLFAAPWMAACQASLSITNSWSLLKLMPIESVMLSRHLILCRSLLLPPPLPPSIRVFSNKSTLGMRWPKYWSFSFSISPSNEHPELISFRMDWLDLLAVQGTLKRLLQHHTSKHQFFPAQLFL